MKFTTSIAALVLAATAINGAAIPEAAPVGKLIYQKSIYNIFNSYSL